MKLLYGLLAYLSVREFTFSPLTVGSAMGCVHPVKTVKVEVSQFWMAVAEGT